MTSYIQNTVFSHYIVGFYLCWKMHKIQKPRSCGLTVRHRTFCGFFQPCVATCSSVHHRHAVLQPQGAKTAPQRQVVACTRVHRAVQRGKEAAGLSCGLPWTRSEVDLSAPRYLGPLRANAQLMHV